MDKVSKFLLKLSRERRERIMPIVACITRNELENLDCAKLGGRNNEYRIRVGSIRIQFVKTPVGNIITKVGFKGDTTYR